MKTGTLKCSRFGELGLSCETPAALSAYDLIAESDAAKFSCNPGGVTGFAVRANVPRQPLQLSVGRRQRSEND